MTSMIDVVFLLLIFFLVTMKFRTLDMKIEADLPKIRGMNVIPPHTPEPPKLIAKLRPAGGDRARVLLSNREIGTTDDPRVWRRFADFARSALERHAANDGDRADFEAEIDAVGGVSTGHVVRTIDAFVDARFEKITFHGAPAPGTRAFPTTPR
jgi:hypothetical protein